MNNKPHLPRLDLRNIKRSKKSFISSFGAFESKQTAEQIIAELRESRISTRIIETFLIAY